MGFLSLCLDLTGTAVMQVMDMHMHSKIEAAVCYLLIKVLDN